MKNVAIYIFINSGDMKYDKARVMIEIIELIITIFRINILFFARRTNTALRTSRSIIIKKISVCQNSKKEALLIGSMYSVSLPKIVSLTALLVIPKLECLTKTSEIRYRDIKTKRALRISLMALSCFTLLMRVKRTIYLLVIHCIWQMQFLNRQQCFWHS